MKSIPPCARTALTALAALPLAGCLLGGGSTIPTRHFLLSPVDTNQPPVASTQPVSVGISFVKMPSYLLRPTMAIRTGANEIRYLENALWGERFDECFQQTLALNLSRLLPSDNVYTSEWGPDQVSLRLLITVRQFDVDALGHGTLIAHWRISPPDKDTTLLSDTTRLDLTGEAPDGNPQAIATTLSNLTADFSRQIARAIRESSRKEQ